MLKQVLPFIIPTPLTERFGFQTRVFTSWISLGLILGLICAIVTLSSGTAAPNGAVALVLEYLISFPIVICFFGLIGLGVNLMRGGDAEHPGWYWWLFPIGVYIVVGIWISALMIGFCLALIGINLPSAPRRTTGRKPTVNNRQRIYKEVKQQQSKKFLDEYEDRLMQLHQDKMKKLQREQVEEQEKKERMESLSTHERILLKIRENPGALLENILTEDEMEELAFMILEVLLEE